MLRIARYELHGELGWGLVRGGSLVPLGVAFDTTGALLVHGRDAIAKAQSAPSRPVVALADVRLVSPVTHNQQIICLGKNYRSHAVETGFDPNAKPFNMVFRKAASSLCGAHDAIVKPRRVQLLDYEVELGLVVGRAVPLPERFEGPDLPDAIGALVVFNDVSARDIQLPELQFYKGKSFRGFGPTGPWLTLVDDGLRARWRELRLQLCVNEESRQDALAGDMIHEPAETLTELSEVQALGPGDLIATGTPSGVAMQRPSSEQAELDSLPTTRRWARFTELQKASGRYLEPGDRVRATIRTDDGTIDLGTLDNQVSGP